MVSAVQYVPGRERMFYDFGLTCAAGNRAVPHDITLQAHSYMSAVLQEAPEWQRLQAGIVAASDIGLKGFLTAVTLSFSAIRGNMFPEIPLLGKTDACRLITKIMDKAILHAPSYSDYEAEEFNPEFKLGISGFKDSALLSMFRCAHEVAHNALKLTFNIDAGNYPLSYLHEYDADVKAHALLESVTDDPAAHDTVVGHYDYKRLLSNANNPPMGRQPTHWEVGRGNVLPLMDSKIIPWGDTAVFLSIIEQAMVAQKRLPSFEGIAHVHRSLCEHPETFDPEEMGKWLTNGLLCMRFDLERGDDAYYNFISVY